METINLKKYRSFIASTSPIRKTGKVKNVAGLIVEGDGPAVPLGSFCVIYSNIRKTSIEAQVVGFRDRTTLLMPLEEIVGIEPGSIIETREEFPTFNISPEILGRVIDGNGRPLDGLGALPMGVDYPINGSPLNPMERALIREPLDLGVRAINGLLTCARGQRLGIFAGTGIGKSVLLGMIARNTEADVNVIALVGERSREVREFIENNLGTEGLKKSVVVAASSDRPALTRIRAALIACAIAEFFRDQGKDVMFMMDSVTRLARAQREIGLSIGEPPTTRGYPPSVFSLLPKILERAGTSDEKGTITGLYTVLVEGDDLDEPVSDAVMAVLDGHIVLSRKLASHNLYPAIDLLNSISRLMIEVVSDDHYELSRQFRDIYATYKEAEDLINIGAYVKGSNPEIDRAIKKHALITEYIRQGIYESVSMDDSIEQMRKILKD